MRGARVQTLIVITISALFAADCTTPPAVELPRQAMAYNIQNARVPVGASYVASAPDAARVEPTYDQIGIASWYGATFSGKRTAGGEAFRVHALTAAHRTLPMGARVLVTNLANGRSLVLRIRDRGPRDKERIIDVSEGAAKLLGFYRQGTAPVRVIYFGRADHCSNGTGDAARTALLRCDSALPILPTPRPPPASRDIDN